MIFEQEKIMIYHPGKCGGTTIERLFLKPLYGVGAASLWADPCLQNKYNYQLTKECLNRRLSCMAGFLARKYEVNGIGNLYLQHADIYASLEIHGADYLDTLFKITFVRNPFPRLLSAYYYNAMSKKSSFRDFVLNSLKQKLASNHPYTVGHFGEMHRYTHQNGEQFVDFIGRLETIATDIDKLSEITGVPLDLSAERQHAKSAASSVYQHYSEAYDDTMIDHVYRLYKKDFELFGYHFEREYPYRHIG